MGLYHIQQNYFRFFYNNPLRENRISLDISSVKGYFIVNSDIEIIYIVNGKRIENKSKIHTTFKWIPEQEGKYI